MKERLLAAARAQGFDDAGVCAAKRWPEMERYDEWLDAGHHGALRYMKKNTHLRRDPGRFFPGAVSVLMVVKGYAVPEPLGRRDGDLVVARFARGKDYHKAMRPGLAVLKALLRDEGYKVRAFIDTGPVMEKVFAVRCGLGVMGMNSLFIHPRLGSWVLLGGLVTDARLHEDGPDEDSPPFPGCLACSACIDACPTGAILRPGVVSARRCLSSWTVEGAPLSDLPVEQLGNRWFGCDRCQEVCPMNRGAIHSDCSMFHPLIPSRWPQEQVISMRSEEFQEHLGHTPLTRAGLPTLQAIAARMSNHRDSQEGGLTCASD